MTTPIIEGIPETWTTQPKRPFSHLIDQELAPSLQRSDSLQSLNERAGQLGLDSGSVGTSSGAQTPVLMDIEMRPKRAKIEKKNQQEVIELSDDSDDDSVIIMEPAWGSKANGNAKGKGKAKVKKVAKVDDVVRGIWWNDQDKEKRRKQFLLANSDIYSSLLPGDIKFPRVLASARQTGPLPTTPLIPYRRLEQPSLISKSAVMKDYQLQGLSFLAFCAENGTNCILADEMGLGKTLQTLSLIAYLAEHHGAKGPHLLVCPLSVLSSWMTEIKRWLPSFKAIRFHGSAAARSLLKEEYLDNTPDLVVTTYEAYSAEQYFFKNGKRWGLCVLDEGHRVKNTESQTSQAVQGVPARMRIILSGTPLQNNLVELWSLLHFLDPITFHQNTMRPFRDSFDLSAGNYDQSFLKKSQKLLELIMLRRTKEGVSSQLTVPPREEMTLYVPLSPAQRFWTKALLARTESTLLAEIFSDFEVKYSSKKSEAAAMRHKRERDEKDRALTLELQGDDGEAEVAANVRRAVEESKNKESGGGQWMKMMNLLMQLRKVSCHPYLLPNAEAEPFEIAEHIVAASSKLMALDKLLAEIIPKGEKVLIFSGFTMMLNILEDFMQLRSYKYARLDGQTSRPRRSLDIKLFQQAKSPYQIFLISTRAGGLGINLTAASTVLLYDQDWNPQVDIQAIARSHRIGQTKTVKVFRLVCQDSVEEQMLTRLRKKLYLSAKVMGTMRNVNENGGAASEVGNDTNQTEDDAPKMTRGELAGILRGGASALAKWTATDGGDPFDTFRASTFDDLVERGKHRDETKEVGIKADLGEELSEEQKRKIEAEEEAAEALLLQGREAVQSRKFEGQMYKASNVEIQQEWQEMQGKKPRMDKSRTVMIDGHSVAKETATNTRWEAVKTITSDPAQLKKLQNTKRTKKTFDHEDFCVLCKDGGEVYECKGCPRVCHGTCSGLSKGELKRMISYSCPQHDCVVCRKTTGECGGLLFRCQLCPDAYCEDCLPSEDLDAVGDILPEFALLGYGKNAQAYFIRCAPCLEHFAENPDAYEAWRKEQDKVEKKARKEGIEF